MQAIFLAPEAHCMMACLSPCCPALPSALPPVQDRGLFSPKAGLLFSPRLPCGIFSPTYHLPGPGL